MRVKPGLSVLMMLLLVVGCATREGGVGRSADTAPLASGTVVELHPTHGNAYTSIRPDQYETLGLVAGRSIDVQVGQKALKMPVAMTYTDVPPGATVAVLHREGLTLAIRDGNFSETYGVKVGDSLAIYAVE